MMDRTLGIKLGDFDLAKPLRAGTAIDNADLPEFATTLLRTPSCTCANNHCDGGEETIC